jgi:hypothetical protein
MAVGVVTGVARLSLRTSSSGRVCGRIVRRRSIACGGWCLRRRRSIWTCGSRDAAISLRWCRLRMIRKVHRLRTRKVLWVVGRLCRRGRLRRLVLVLVASHGDIRRRRIIRTDCGCSRAAQEQLLFRTGTLARTAVRIEQVGVITSIEALASRLVQLRRLIVRLLAGDGILYRRHMAVPALVISSE